MPFRLEPTDIILILLVGMLLFGATRLPEIGRGVGRAIVEFRRGLRDHPENSGEAGSQGMDAPSHISQPPTTGRIDRPQETVGNYCTQCGGANPLGARYCGQCGREIRPVETIRRSE